MKSFSVSNDIVPVGKFKAGLAKYLKHIRENGNSLIITQNGEPAGVLVSPALYDELTHTRQFIESVSRGISESRSGDLLSTPQLKRELKKIRTR